MDVSDFASGEKIYISVTTNGVCSNTNLEYKFYESFTHHSDADALEQVSYTSSTTKNGKEKYNYEIKKPSGGYSDLYLESYCPPVTFENTEDGGSTVGIILAIVFSVIALAIIIAIIVYCCRRCKRAVASRVHYPVTPATPVYGVAPYTAQPVVGVGMAQPVMNVQPYGVNTNYAPSPIPNVNQNYIQATNNQYVQYNSATPVQPGSDVRINQDLQYEKPH